MKIDEIIPPRRFKVGSGEIHHCANIQLDPDEQVTFVTDSGREYDIMKKSWGFFATPSLNSRLKKFGFRTALVEDSGEKRFICLVEADKEEEFSGYLEQDNAKVLCWLSDSSYSLL